MKQDYNPQAIEAKWQQHWFDEHPELFAATDDATRPKYYNLVEFPYPSGEGLHVGHPRSFTALDVVSRKRRMEGFNVLYPIGFDAFGLPAENYAIKTGVHPHVTTEKNIANFTRQLKALGFSFDWSRAFNTTDPAYYRWTQWIFSQFFKYGLAYKDKMEINFCPKDKVGLANEEVVNGCCERCGTEVIKREKEQWMLRITDYADRLDRDLDQVNFLEKIKSQQRNWIGRSEGAEITFRLNVVDQETGKHQLKVFTTRPDTIYGVTFVAVSAELAKSWLEVGWTPGDEVTDYIAELLTERAKIQDVTADNSTKEKTGIDTGVMAINPLTGEEVPVWIVNYVLGNVGTGAIMAVPAHDERDFAFAKKYNLPIKTVVSPTAAGPELVEGKPVEVTEAYLADGYIINSEMLNGLNVADATQKVIDRLMLDGTGRGTTTYKLRDWVFSRQRYWGEPMPLVHCATCAKVKQKVLIIHGFESRAEDFWLPWLKNELEKQGFEVFAPTMTTAGSPDLAVWMAELQPYFDQLGADDIIVGHSLGAKAAMHLIAEAKSKVGHLFCVGSAPLTTNGRDWDLFAKKWRKPLSDFAALRKFWEESLDLNIVKNNVGAVTTLISYDDPFVGDKIDVIKVTMPTGWRTVFVDDQGHFIDTRNEHIFSLIQNIKNTGWRLIPDDQLPVLLPEVTAFQPGQDGESPLADLTDWVETTCPHCGGPARRETDTMPQWAGSSWYFLRYIDPRNNQSLADSDKLKYWLTKNDERNSDGVDWYNGGMEHTTLHLLYSRFWHKFLYDLKIVPVAEPYGKRTSQGMILGEGGIKMSKSKGNVVNPDDIISQYGADTFRLYEMFMGPFDQAIPWDAKSIIGMQRFLDRIWDWYQVPPTIRPMDLSLLESSAHKLIKKVSADVEELRFNTAISALMVFSNEVGDLQKRGSGSSELVNAADSAIIEVKEYFLQLLSLFAPHMAEELWQQLGHSESLTYQPWPKYNQAKIVQSTIEMAVQINGKLRATIDVAPDISEAEAVALAKAEPNVVKYLEGAEIKKTIFVAGKIVGFVV